MKNSLDKEQIPYEEKHGYVNPTEEKEWASKATRILLRAVAITFFLFVSVISCERF